VRARTRQRKGAQTARCSALFAHLSCLSVLLGCNHACPVAGWHPEVPEAPEAGAAPEEEPQPLKGDATCPPGAPDCNVCAPDIQAQFEAAQWRGEVRGWSFEPRPGHAVPPRRAYFAGLNGHAQGFVRLNTPGEAYAMVHSKGRPRGFASLSFLADTGSRLELLSLFPLAARGGHTTGAFALGDQLGVLVKPRTLAFVDVASALAGTPRIRHIELWNPDDGLPFMAAPKAHGLTDWSGGIAIAKRAPGDYVLLANEGGDRASSGRSHVFIVAPTRDLLDGSQVPTVEVGKASYPVGFPLCAEHHHSENASLVTECGSGDLYAVHVGSNDSVRARGFAPGAFHTFWRLSRLIVQDGEVTLEPRGVYLRRASLDHCHGRSAGSVYVDPETRRLHLLCHEREQHDAERGRWHFWQQVSGGNQ
jgi:hypothetical protein